MYNIIHFSDCNVRWSITSVNWNGQLTCIDINEAFDVFLQNYLLTSDEEKEYFSSKYPLWFNALLKQLILI